MRLRIDPVACDAHGLCAELLPELIALDDWGHPVLVADQVPPGLTRLSRRAVSACPTLALHLEAGDRRRDAGADPQTPDGGFSPGRLGP